MDRTFPSPLLLEQARRRHRRSIGVLATAAAVTGLSAVVLLTVAFLAGMQAAEAEEPAAQARGARTAIEILSKPGSEQLPLAGSAGRVVLAVGPAGGAALLLDDLGPAPEGGSFQAWVLGPNGEPAVPAAVFAGTEVAVPLRVRVPRGARVAVTVEDEDGAETLVQTPRLAALRP